MNDHLIAGRYRLVEPLGAGGMGTVWRAHDGMLGRDVAIKQVELPEDAPPDEVAMLCERASREARAAAMLDHPGIITVHDVVVPDDRPWIVMELVEGRSLDRVVEAGGPLPPRRVAEIGVRLLDALAAAHGRGLLHRDVKPANVLLADDGRIILTDFGIAALDGDPALTRTGGLVGSPGFIAPERLRDQPAGPACDLWSLGATLYAAAEGRAPFERDAPLAALGATLSEEPPPPARAGPLAPVLTRLLAKDPAARIGAAQAGAALRRVAAGAPGLAASTGPAAPAVPAVPAAPAAPRARRFPRGRAALVASAALAVAAVAVPFALLVGSGDGRSAPRPARTGPRPVLSVNPCALITDAQARRLLTGAVRKPDTPRTGQCSWHAPKVPGVLTIREPIVTDSFGAGPDRMAIERDKLAAASRSSASRTTWTWPEGGFPRTRVRTSGPTAVQPLRDGSGVGDEAVTYTEHGDNVPVDSVIILVREGNVIINLRLDGPSVGPSKGPSPAADDARQAAQMIAATLARLENRG